MEPRPPKLPLNFLRLHQMVASSPSIFELYLVITHELWSHWKNEILELFGPSSMPGQPHGAPIAIAGARAHKRADAILGDLESPDPEGFDVYAYLAFRTVAAKAIAGAINTPDDTLSIALTVATNLLTLVDGTVGARLETDYRACTYPAEPDSSGYTIVARRNPSYYSMDPGKMESSDFEAGSLRTMFAGILRSTYAVPPAVGDDQFKWRIRRLPDTVEARLLEQGKGNHRVLLVGLPHEFAALQCTHAGGQFHVHGLDGESERRIVEALWQQLPAELQSNKWSVIVLPEYTGTPAIRTCLEEILKAHPRRVALVIPGSARELEDELRVRNRCQTFSPAGRPADHPSHCKLTRFELTKSVAPEEYHAAIAANNGKLIEGITVEHSPITFWDSPTLGRTVVLICRDLLEQSPRAFLRHHFLDQMFVPAMSPSLDEFAGNGAHLAGMVGAGLFVANAPLWPVEGGRHAALGYRPVRGSKRNAIRPCQADHAICLHGFEMAKGWMS